MALLEPKVERIAPVFGPPAEPAADRVPDRFAAGTPEPLRGDLVALLGPDRVLSRPLDLVGYASDASPYRLIPQVVVMAHDAGDVAKVLGYAREHGVPATFRAGGSSLNGQAQSDGILIDVRRHFAGVRVEDQGAIARVGPGTVLGHANRVLARHGRRLGPDPASSETATVGGVIANNSGGMRCGITQDSYRTVRSMTLVLASGTSIDTAAPDAEQRFAEAEPELAAGLTRIRDQIRAEEDLVARIERKFEIKNTTGYRLCAFLDADTPLEIFRRLVVGSEGTLAFIAEAVMETVPRGRHTATALLGFDDLDSAAAAVGPLVAAGTSATELMVAPTLIAAAHNMPGTPEAWKELPFDSAAVLCDFHADGEPELDELEAAGLRALEAHATREPAEFTRDREFTEMLWRVREGMFGLIGAMRPEGVTLIAEDVCVRPERVAEATRDLQALLGEHGFLPGVAGHASAGNLHFLLTPNFTVPADRERYDAFMHGLAELIVDRYDGSLKAEHGTGLNMAPFVAREWGERATELMWKVKALADPDGVLAPGVVLNRDPEVHLRNLKSNPAIDELATKCVECGFCEPVCPSRDVTTTPRQRIVLLREMARQPAGSALTQALLADYEYDAIQTCAVDGSCKPVCPVGIDTGKLVKKMREREHSERAERIALGAAKRWAAVERGARAGLRAGDALRGALGEAPLRGGAAAVRAVVSDDLVPTWPRAMPSPAPATLPGTSREGAAAVYLPACINRIFGAPPGAPEDALSVPAALVAVSARAGHPVWIPAEAPGHCCATPWTSKGYREGAEFMAAKTVDALWEWSDGGRLPVVTDASSCALGLGEDVVALLDDVHTERHAGLEVLDSVAWVNDRLLGDLTITAGKVGSVAVHPTCSGRHLGLTEALAAIAGSLAEEVVVPAAATCCGFAGDRGMLHPELTAAATRGEAAELAGRSFDAHLSSNRTCEIGMQEATGAPYQSFVVLLEQLTRGSLIDEIRTERRHADADVAEMIRADRPDDPDGTAP